MGSKDNNSNKGTEPLCRSCLYGLASRWNEERELSHADSPQNYLSI